MWNTVVLIQERKTDVSLVVLVEFNLLTSIKFLSLASEKQTDGFFYINNKLKPLCYNI